MITIKDRSYNEEERRSIFDLFQTFNQSICAMCCTRHNDLYKVCCGTRLCPYRHMLYDTQCVIDWAEDRK